MHGTSYFEICLASLVLGSFLISISSTALALPALIVLGALANLLE